MSASLSDHVAIKRAQQWVGLKLKFNFLDPYLVTVVDYTYDDEKIAPNEGQKITTTCVEYIKSWVYGH